VSQMTLALTHYAVGNSNARDIVLKGRVFVFKA
jgi:hypothetical protein